MTPMKWKAFREFDVPTLSISKSALNSNCTGRLVSQFKSALFAFDAYKRAPMGYCANCATIADLVHLDGAGVQETPAFMAHEVTTPVVTG